MTKRARVLLVDDSSTIRTMLADWLRERYEVTEASSGAEALEVLGQEPFDLVLSDINMPGMNGFETLRRARALKPQVKTALITDYNVDTYIRIALEEDITNIIVKDAPFDVPGLFRTLEGLLDPSKVWGLKNYLASGATISSARLTTSQETERIREAIVSAALGGAFTASRANTLRMVFEEIASNALYHAYGYKKFERVQLGNEEVIEIDWGHDESRVGFAVRDYSGRLSKDIVLRKILRAMSPAGVLDTDGRGLFLTRSFSDRFIINIQPGERTEIIVLNCFGAPEEANRPLYINQS